MDFDYRFPLFEQLLHGNLNPLLPSNASSTDYHLRLTEQIVIPTRDMGFYKIRFETPKHPKEEYYHRLLVSETLQYCNDLLAYLHDESDTSIRTYLRNTILDNHLSTCLIRLGEIINSPKQKKKEDLNSTPSDLMDGRCNSYVFQLLKICIAKVYMDVQEELKDVVIHSLTEEMLYANYFNELPPIHIFLSRRKNPANPAVSEKLVKDKTTNTLPENSTEIKKEETKEKLSTEYLVVKEVASQLRKDKRSILRLIEKGKLKAVKSEGSWLIDKIDLEDYLNSLKNMI